MRAYLIVAGKDEHDGDDDGGADALVIDAGRALPRTRPGAAPIVRVAGIEAPDLSAQLDAALSLRPRAILLPAAQAGEVAHLGARLAVHEAQAGLPDGGTGILALLGSARGVLAAGRFSGVSPRLRGLGWDADALAAELGTAALAGGDWIPPLAQARALTRLAAAAAGVPALEAAYPGEDAEAFRRCAAAARRDGFSAMLARNGAQTRIIRAGCEDA